MALEISTTKINESSQSKYVEIKGTFKEVFEEIQRRESLGRFSILIASCIDAEKRIVILEYPNI